nr:hypothetical protein [Candidatus Sigynarchaeota archaeon]
MRSDLIETIGMFLDAFPMYGPLWDIYFLLGAFSTFVYFYVAVTFSHRWKNSGIHLTAKGFLLFIVSLGVLQGYLSVQMHYVNEIDFPLYVGRSAICFFIAGMIAFVVCAEADKKRHQKDARGGLFKYPASLMVIILTAPLVPVSLAFIFELIYVVFGYTIPVFLYFTFFFIKQFSRLQSIRAGHAGWWILSGVAFSFLGLLLYNTWMWAWNNPAVPFINNGCMLCAAIVMTQGWKCLPGLSELEWLSSLEYVVVIRNDNKIPIFFFHFQQGTKVKNMDPDHIDLYGSMMGGIDTAIGEILASNGHIKEISHENKTLAFTTGRYCTFILIVSRHFDEIRFRLERFALDFEEQFTARLASANSTDTSQYNAAKSLITRHFS